MLNGFKSVNTENQVKDFKKLGRLVSIAKGYRTIGNFAADCRLDVEIIDNIINLRLATYPSIKHLEIISDNSEGRVSLKDLKVACGYSLYANNDLEQIKNLQVRRGWFCLANYGDKAIDSEMSGRRTVLVIQNDRGNLFSSNTIIIPLTSRKTKKPLPTHVLVDKGCGLREDSVISCELIDTVSKRRLFFRGGIQRVAECPPEILKKVGVAINKAMGVIDLDVSEEDAIEMLAKLNNRKRVCTYSYEHNYNARTQTVFA